MSDEDNSVDATVGEAIEGDVPADAEVEEGQQPTSPIDGEEVEGRQCWRPYPPQRPAFRIVICPYHGCHVANRVGYHVRWVHCWNCHRNFRA